MNFSNLEEMIKYIEKQNIQVNNNVAEDIVEIAKNETQREQNKYTPSTYKRTGNLLECIKPTKINKNEIEVTWTDAGWSSYSGKPFYAPAGLESGKTYGKGGYRPKTNFVENTERRIKKDLGDIYKKRMKQAGIPVK